MRKTSVLSVAVMLLLGVLSACTRAIGDGCVQNVDCSPAGDRFCDIASPGGYCTIEGCDYNTCPDGAVCVRFFDLLRGAPGCQPGSTPRPDCRPGDTACCRHGDPGCCAAGEQCLCAEQRDDKGCAKAYCASETSERRWCMRKCDNSKGCREGYSCYETGENGAVPVPRPADVALEPVRYCAPVGGMKCGPQRLCPEGLKCDMSQGADTGTCRPASS